ncbi:TniB family NTP-binding protein [Aestuariicella sp. G3-2]|uniref:TniB family NTP-binding protein n=1 Tax=Pseudomaricurvus albidus TaxID=2842452 RepID=UPI001C0B7CE4|nr:TniB family NTP-binding protein [Aestuariicella albida]MBU3068263.1 TniB family NTP-binding protein [Aestuariicella albida]
MNKTTLERLENNVVIAHKNFKQVYDKLERYFQHGRSDEAICVIAPAGMGKTTMGELLISDFQSRQDNGWMSDYAPPVMIEMPSQYNNDFPWKAFIESILEKLGDCGMQSKVDLDENEELRRKGFFAQKTTRLSIAKLEKLLRERIKAFRPIVIVFDESQNMVEGLSESKKRENVNRIKNWANTMETKFVFFGTHGAKGFLNLNEQLARRVVPIYFPRYKKNNPEDCKHFFDFYVNLIENLEIPIDKNVLEDFDFIYNHTLGCPGILSSWLHSSIAFCLENNFRELEKSILEEFKFSFDRLSIIEREVKIYELYFESTQQEFCPSLVCVDDIGQMELIENPKTNIRRGNRKSKPGTQKPRRYPVHDTQC